MAVAICFTDEAKKNWEEYIDIHVKESNVKPFILQDMEDADPNEEFGFVYEINSRYTKSGNPLPVHISATDWVWVESDNVY